MTTTEVSCQQGSQSLRSGLLGMIDRNVFGGPSPCWLLFLSGHSVVSVTPPFPSHEGHVVSLFLQGTALLKTRLCSMRSILVAGVFGLMALWMFPRHSVLHRSAFRVKKSGKRTPQFVSWQVRTDPTSIF